MKKTSYRSYDELPLMLSVPEVAAVLGISRAGAYELVRAEGFPGSWCQKRNSLAGSTRRWQETNATVLIDSV